MRIVSGVEYGRPKGQSLLLDACIPDGPGPFPAVVVVHGGAWVTGDRRLSVEPLLQPLAAAGMAWFSISYRLANVADVSSLANLLTSATVVNEAVDDVRQALAFVREHTAVDPGRVALIGESAGAQLASIAALKPNGPAVRGVVALYSPSDLGSMIRNSERIPAAVRAQFRGTPLEAMLMNVLRELSPITWVHGQAPPFLLIHGTEDPVVPYGQSVEMCKALRGVGAECELVAVPWGGHGMRRWRDPGYQGVMVDWLRGRLS